MKNISPEVLSGCRSKETIETEVAFYCLIGNPEGLKEATHIEKHHQLECRFETGSSSRVRKTTDEKGERYVFTIKIKTEGGENSPVIERNKTVDKDFFDDYRLVAKRELDKTRYIFDSKNVTMLFTTDGEEHEVTIPNIQYEVDVYKKEDGTDSQYCKIDIEVDNIVNFINTNHPQIKNFNLRVKLSHLPFEPKDPIRSEDPSKKDKMDKIWKEFARILR